MQVPGVYVARAEEEEGARSDRGLVVGLVLGEYCMEEVRERLFDVIGVAVDKLGLLEAWSFINRA